ncbi:MAG TPA: bifunctional lysylphosphatidylglycerol flippase/synthetase MprF [Prolixibacteraceae bacterium]|nr:bifunctional lysylphosphatidylglycerol flippase/synthetase MprF [Prolixibacteraceae bacterium]
MKRKISVGSISAIFKEHANPFLRENKKIIIQFIFTLFFIAIGIWFIQHERSELFQVKDVLKTASAAWVMIGIVLTAIYILLQGQMYVFAFASTRSKVSLLDSTLLFIKRNLISVFLPAGGISSLAFFTGTIESKGIKNSQIHFASSIYGFIGILSVVIVAIPAFIYAIVEGTIGSGEWYALAAVILLKFALLFLYRSILKKGIIYSILVRLIPATEVFMNDLQSNKIDKKQFIYTVLVSILIEFIGIAHLYVAMMALNFNPSILAAVMGYIISVIFLIISPFLRGLGAIEVSMTYILIRFGFGNVEAIAITFLYRFFEFWTPLFAGILAFLSKLNKLLMRVLPAFFLLILGVINIISVLTPAIHERITLLKDFLPVQAIHVSNYLVMTAGLLLLVTAAFLLKGLKSAWWFALILSLISLVGHLTKAIDFEEATLALLVVAVLVGTRKEYYIKTNPRLRNVGLQTSLLTAAATLIYGIVGFYFLDKKHFNIDFSLIESFRYTIQNYFLVGSDELVPASKFAAKFLLSINISGFLSFAFLVYTFVRSHVPQQNVTDEELALSNQILKSHGNSPLDYFKTSSDKMIFFSENKRAFISYGISGNFAVVLENPVAENPEEMKKCISEFDLYCYQSGMKSIYYRVPEESLKIYHQLRKKDLFLGQEGVVNISTFSLVGSTKKPIRNAINKVTDRGYKASIHLPPVKDGILQKIKSVSDEWLSDMGRSEIIFSQGMFDWDELKQQTIITVENAEEKIVAFLNIIPDFAKFEATYDLIRKTKDAPNGVMDFIIIELFNYLKSQNITYVNLGFAPLSGLNDPHTFPEKSMKFAYEKIRSFAHYRGLREYKEKFDPEWHNQYLIYQHDYDLLQVPSVLANVIKP